MQREIRDVKLEEMLPFKDSLEQTYEDGWVQQLADCISRASLLEPVIARPVDGGKYEILCGHNRIKALELLGCKSIHTEIRDGISDDEATALYNGSHLNKKLFSSCGYSQKFEIIKCCEKFIKENSRQGKRTDLEDRTAITTLIGTADTCTQLTPSSKEGADRTCTQLVPNIQDGDKAPVPNLRPKESHRFRRPTIRDKVAKDIGISKATFDRYLRIIKLPDELLQSIACLLDEKKITFEAAYYISNMMDADIESLIRDINKYPDGELDLDKVKNSQKRNAKESDDIIYPKTRNSAWMH